MKLLLLTLISASAILLLINIELLQGLASYGPAYAGAGGVLLLYRSSQCMDEFSGKLRRGGTLRSWKKILPELRIRIYELPAILILTFLVFVSVWRCYYQPPLSRDVLSGPEAIAEFAVREHTMVNSIVRDIQGYDRPIDSQQVWYRSMGVFYHPLGCASCSRAVDPSPGLPDGGTVVVMINNQLLIRLSQWIGRWEQGRREAQ